MLYGSAAVARVDGIIASGLGLGLALATLAFSRRPATPDGPATFADRAAALAAVGSVAALAISSVNLFWPAERPGIAKPACAGAHTTNVPYVGITIGPDGNNSRSGPARSYAANGRFAKDCSLGFSAYCVGEPIGEAAATIPDVQTWKASRWLLLAKQNGGVKDRLAQLLSGETAGPQFVADAAVVPATSYEQLPQAPADVCSASFTPPGRASLSPFDARTQKFTATAEHAVNMGFAAWTPPGQGFLDEDGYHQIFSLSKPAADNPGTTVNGGKSVVWTYKETLLKNLRPNRAKAPALVVVMAVPCISANLPAEPTLAGTATYDIASSREPRPQPALTGFDPGRLARAACQANA
ncbi:hypothetical protein BS329_17950 [Amycolatopsis coloradensis]|uniref:Uncharacterized protein n=1 Tax=Amycolatopsis coloradensis TaxID=76021 RepID=A0A1R0KT65_9PSEU|nr:hypothetical protein BS329_17950 [Amycolatopsis coloradensis]